MPQPKRVPDPTATKQKILIVDDDVLALTALSAGLRRFGYDVVEAVNAQSALAEISKSVPDLAILDIRMPVMSGPQLAVEIYKIAKVPIVYLSAYADADRVRQAIDTAPVAYLVKPVDAMQLVPEIETALALAKNMAQCEAKNSNLEHALNGKRTVSTAIGIIMTNSGCNRDEAFELLRKSARSSNRNMEEVSESVLAATEMLGNFRQTPGK